MKQALSTWLRARFETAYERFVFIFTIVLSIDICIRLAGASFLFRPDGALPAAVLEQFFRNVSVHAPYEWICHWPKDIWLTLLSVELILLGAFLFFRNRWIIVCVLLIQLCVNARIAPLATGSDPYLLLGLFWLFVLPRDDGKSDFLKALMLLQLVLTYVDAGTAKLAEERWRDGSALSLYLRDQLFARFPEFNWRSLESWLMFLNYLTIFFEIVCAPICLALWRTEKFRRFAVAAFVAFHAMTLFLFHIGTIPFICLSLWLIFSDGSTQNLRRLFNEFLGTRRATVQVVALGCVILIHLITIPTFNLPNMAPNGSAARLVRNSLYSFGLVGSFAQFSSVSLIRSRPFTLHARCRVEGAQEYQDCDPVGTENFWSAVSLENVKRNRLRQRYLSWLIGDSFARRTLATQSFGSWVCNLGSLDERLRVYEVRLIMDFEPRREPTPSATRSELLPQSTLIAKAQCD